MAKYFFDESKTKEFVNELVNQPEFDLLVGELFPEIPILNNKFKTRSKNQLNTNQYDKKYSFFDRCSLDDNESGYLMSA